MWDPNLKHTRIKLCEFESLDSAYEASFIGADALGFHIFKHQDVEEKATRFQRIFEFLPAAVNRTLLTDLDLEPLLELLVGLRANTIQLYPDWSVDEIEKLRANLPSGVKILKVMSAQLDENRISNPREFLEYYGRVSDGFLLDSYRIGGTGKTGDWGLCADIVKDAQLPVFLAGGLTAQNVNDAIRRVRPFGVDVENGVSDRIPGGPLVKNMFKCREFVAAVRLADQQNRSCVRGWLSRF